MEALVLNKAIKNSSSTILGLAGIVSIALGLIRGIFFSGMNNWASLFTPYGRYFISAIFLSILMIVVGRRYGSNLVKIPWKDEASRDRSLIQIYLTGTVILVCYFLLLFCMVKMRFGGY